MRFKHRAFEVDAVQMTSIEQMVELFDAVPDPTDRSQVWIDGGIGRDLGDPWPVRLGSWVLEFAGGLRRVYSDPMFRELYEPAGDGGGAMSVDAHLTCPIEDCDEERPHSASHWTHRALDYRDGGRDRSAVAVRCNRAAEFMRERGVHPLRKVLVAAVGR